MEDILNKIKKFSKDQAEKSRKRRNPTREEKRASIAKSKKRNPGDKYYDRLEKQYANKWAKEDITEGRKAEQEYADKNKKKRFNKIKRTLASTDKD